MNKKKGRRARGKVAPYLEKANGDDERTSRKSHFFQHFLLLLAINEFLRVAYFQVLFDAVFFFFC